MIALTAHAQQLTFTTFAGPAGGPGSTDGTGSAARFNFPAGVAADSAGNVYVADTGNATIRKITPTGVVTTLAGRVGINYRADGTGNAALFDDPTGVATDGGGNVYVADYDNSAIRKITAAGVVTTFAGSPGHRGNADGVGSAARFDSPFAVATDSGGNVYVCDSYLNAIRKITPTAVVTTLADSISCSGVAVDSGGNVYVSSSDNHTIRKITPAGVVTIFAGSVGVRGSANGAGIDARFDYPIGLATDGGGNVYVADAGNYTVRKITPAGVVTTVAGSAGVSGSADGTGGAARFDYPAEVTTDSGGNLYVADIENCMIRKITPAGVVTTLAGSGGFFGSTDGIDTAARFSDPSGVATDSVGNVYVTDTRNKTIRKITSAGVVSTLAGAAGFSGSANGTGSAARFDYPEGVAVDGGGNLFVADLNEIRKITAAGVVTTFAGSAGNAGSDNGAGGAARFFVPSGVATDNGGNVYVADTYNETIRKITAAGVVTTLAGSAGLQGDDDGIGSAARFHRPRGVATDSSRNVFVTPGPGFSIRKITPDGAVTSIDANTAFANGVATDSGGNVYLSDLFGSTINKITPAGVITTLAGTRFAPGTEDGTGGAARFYAPNPPSDLLNGVATDSVGNVYVVDSYNNKIRIGRPALSDVAVIDAPVGIVGVPRQLSTSTQTATSWQWSFVRQPSASSATLSSTSVRNPVFIPDVPDLYIFRLVASDGVKTSITTVELKASYPRRRAVGH